MTRCRVEGCDRHRRARGYCNAHYQRLLASGDPQADKPLRQPHGHAVGKTSPTYDSWRAMRDRCTQPSNKKWAYYGGRGVTICDRWQGPDGFTHFLADMGERPEGLTLDRIDPDGDYEPGNCRWATRREQNLNRRPRKAMAA